MEFEVTDQDTWIEYDFFFAQIPLEKVNWLVLYVNHFCDSFNLKQSKLIQNRTDNGEPKKKRTNWDQ